ncbi:MAG: ATP-binding protein [Bacteroidota bacterium]
MQNFEKIELLDALFNNATEGIIIANDRGLIQLMNPAACKMFGYETNEILNESIDQLVPRNIKERHEHLRNTFAENPHARPMGHGLDLHGLRKDNSLFPIEISLSPISKDNKKYIIAFLIDISVRKQIEAAVNQKQLELEQIAVTLQKSNEDLERKVSDRTKVLQEAIAELEKSRTELSMALEKEKDLNDLKSRFISMASHEFRTPLTTILSSAVLISEYKNPDQDEKRQKHIKRIQSSVNNLNDILSDFLSISKLEEGKIHADMTTFDLNALIHETVLDMSQNTKTGQEIAVGYNGDDYVFLDIKLMKNILFNLLSNAIKFSSEGKTITIDASVDSNEIKVIVQDQGIGISDEDQKHLFERFYRGKNAFNIQGTGLGLHIIGNYVDIMKGHLHLTSKLNEGTRIEITFPNQIN